MPPCAIWAVTINQRFPRRMLRNIRPLEPCYIAWPHEMKTAEALAADGRAVGFIRRSEQQRATPADAIVDGLIWEMKAPKAPNLKAVEKSLRKATGQYAYVIFDSRRMKGIPDHAIERELRVCAAGRVKALKRLLFVNRQAQVIGIKREPCNIGSAKRPNGEPSPTSGALAFSRRPKVSPAAHSGALSSAPAL